jgi:hypothetical protein
MINGAISHYTYNTSFNASGLIWYVRIFYTLDRPGGYRTISVYTENHKIDVFWNSWEDMIDDLQNGEFKRAGANGLVYKTVKKGQWCLIL